MKKRIIIIGGGFTGTRCARKLEKKFSVTLIDCKPYFEFTPSVLRTILEPRHCKKIQRMHSDYLKMSDIIVGKVTGINDKAIYLENGHKINFDYLIISSGSSYASPIKDAGLIPTTRADKLANYHDDLEKAKNILIIGGGLVGGR